MPILIAESGERFTFDDEIGSPTFSSPVSVSSFPIPNAAPTTNHVQVEQETLSTTLRVTGTRSQFIIPGINDGPDEEGKNYFDEAVSFMRRNRDNAFTFISEVYGTINNFVITDLSWGYSNVDHVHFNISGTFIERAFEEFVEIPPVRHKKKGTTKPKDKGDKAPKQKQEEVPDRLISTLARGEKPLSVLGVKRGYLTEPMIRDKSAQEFSVYSAPEKRYKTIFDKPVNANIKNIGTSRPGNPSTPGAVTSAAKAIIY